MRKFSLLAALLLALGFFGLHFAHAAPATNQQQFMARFVMSETKDGKQVVTAQPTLLMQDGQEANFLAGGEAPADAEGKEMIPFGTKASINIHEIAADKLRVSIYVGQSNLDSQNQSNFVVHESGVHCVRTIKSGEKIELDFGSGQKATVEISRQDISAHLK